MRRAVFLFQNTPFWIKYKGGGSPLVLLEKISTKKSSKAFRINFRKARFNSSFTHTFASTNKHNVCCYSTNCLRRWPQSHQGPSTYGLFFAFTVRVRSKMRGIRRKKKDVIITRTRLLKKDDIFDRLFARYIRAFPRAIRILFAQLTIKRRTDGTY